MLFELIEDNFVAVVMTLFLILYVMTNNNFEKKTNQLFLGAAVCILILIVEEAWEAQLALSAVYEPLRVPLSAIGYSLRPAIPYLLFMMGKRYTKAQVALVSAPLVCNALVAFSALFCGISFGYSADNEFVRGPLGLTPFVIAAFYVIILLLRTIRECERGGFMEAMIVSAIALLTFLSTVMESLFHFRFIQNPCMAISVTFYYLFLHSNQNNRDSLTGALTRRRFYFDASKYCTTLSAVISLDLNDLKTLNDVYGHTEGDRALITVTKTVKEFMGPRASLYRTGGDEFMILCHKLKEEKVQAMIRGIRDELEKTDYRCAIGYAMYSHEQTFDSVCQTADYIMYEDKRRMKGAGLREGAVPVQ